jgi:hypothetical protein
VPGGRDFVARQTWLTPHTALTFIKQTWCKSLLDTKYIKNGSMSILLIYFRCKSPFAPPLYNNGHIANNMVFWDSSLFARETWHIGLPQTQIFTSPLVYLFPGGKNPVTEGMSIIPNALPVITGCNNVRKETCVLCLSAASYFCYVKPTRVCSPAPVCSCSCFPVLPWFWLFCLPRPWDCLSFWTFCTLYGLLTSACLWPLICLPLY